MRSACNDTLLPKWECLSGNAPGVVQASGPNCTCPPQAETKMKQLHRLAPDMWFCSSMGQRRTRSAVRCVKGSQPFSTMLASTLYPVRMKSHQLVGGLQLFLMAACTMLPVSEACGRPSAPCWWQVAFQRLHTMPCVSGAMEQHHHPTKLPQMSGLSMGFGL